MTDIVVWLRACPGDAICGCNCVEAATEIERLRALLKAQSDMLTHMEESNEKLATEIERLQAQMTIFENVNRTDAAEIERLRRELNLLKAVHENAEAEVRQLLDENGPLIAVCREFIDRWPTEQGIDNTIQRARAILLDHDLRSPPEHAVNRALEGKRD